MSDEETSGKLHLRTLSKRVWRVQGVVGLVSAILAGAVVAHGLRPTPGQLELLAPLVAGLALVAAALLFVLNRRILAPLRAVFTAEPAAVADRELSRRAFACAIEAPRRLAALGCVLYSIAALIAVAALRLRFDGIDGSVSATIAVCAAVMGLPCQVAAYFPYKRIFERATNRLALDLPDPRERLELVAPFPLALKLGIATLALTLATLVATAVVIETRTQRSLEVASIRTSTAILRELSSRSSADRNVEQLLRHANSVYGRALGLSFFTLEPGRGPEAAASDSESPGPGDLIGVTPLSRRERERIRASGLQGDSLGLSGPRIFAWQTLPNASAILVASIPRELALAGSESAAAPLAILASTLLLAIAAVMRVFALDVRKAFEALRSQLRQVAAGDLTGAGRFESDDEFGEIDRELDQMTSALRNNVGALVEAFDRMSGSVDELEGFGESLSQVNRAQVEDIVLVGQAMGSVTGNAEGIALAASELTVSMDESSAAASEILAVGTELNMCTSSLSGHVARSSSALDELRRNGNAIAQTSELLEQAVVQSAGSIDEISQQIRLIENRASETSRLAERSSSAAAKGRDSVEKTIDGMIAIASVTEKAESVVVELGQRVDEIDQILAVIDLVADETSLLALNAAIISAQSGDQGLAFGVVSREIKALARRVGDSTSEIAAVIDGLHTKSASAVSVMQDGVGYVKNGLELARIAGAALEEINESAEASTVQVKAIADSVVDHQRAAGAAVDRMEHVRDNASAIRTANSEQLLESDIVRESAAAVSELTTLVDSTTSEQAKSTGYIVENLDKVRDSISGINRALEDQRSACRATEERLGKLRDSTQENGVSNERLDAAMKALREQSESLRLDIRRFQL